MRAALRRISLPTLLLALSPLAFGAAVLRLGQNIDYDFTNYHWYNAYALLTGRTTGGVDMLPAQLQTFFSPFLDVPFYLLGTHLPARAAYFILGCVQGLNFVLLFLLARHALAIADARKKDLICAGLALFGMTGSAAINALGRTFNDNLTSLGIFASILLILRGLDALLALPTAKAARRVFLYGLPAGLMVGLKTTCGPFAVGLCAGLLFIDDDWRKCLRLAIFCALGVGAGFLISYGWWGWFLYARTGNPFFPNFSNLFPSPYFPPQGLVKDFYAPRDGWVFFFPLLFAVQPGVSNFVDWHDLRIPVFYALMIAIAVWRGILCRKSAAPSSRAAISISVPRTATFLLTTSMVSYYLWLLVFDIYRYLLPLEMMAPLLIVLCLDMIPLRQSARLLLASSLMLAVVATARPDRLDRRATWMDRVVAVDRPALPDDGSLMILMAGYDGYAHMISEFPPGIPFVRVQSRSFFPRSGRELGTSGMSTLIQHRIDAHKGRFMVMVPFIDANDARRTSFTRALAAFGLETVPGECQPALDRLAGYRYALCDAVRR